MYQLNLKGYGVTEKNLTEFNQILQEFYLRALKSDENLAPFLETYKNICENAKDSSKFVILNSYLRDIIQSGSNNKYNPTLVKKACKAINAVYDYNPQIFNQACCGGKQNFSYYVCLCLAYCYAPNKIQRDLIRTEMHQTLIEMDKYSRVGLCSDYYIDTM